MRRAPNSIAALICVSLLGMQLSGLHMHVNPQDDSGGLHTSHGHNLDPNEHDHGADIDVSVLELGTTWSKILTFLLPLAIMLLAIVMVLQTIWPPAPPRHALRWRMRWRPPLRAPPLSI